MSETSTNQGRPQTGVNPFAKIGRIVLELGDERCRQIYFAPLGETFRGRWTRNSLVGQSVSNATDLAHMPDIPGIHLKLDPHNRLAVAFDPLSLPENSDLCAKIKAHYDSLKRGENGGPMPDKVHRNLQPSTIKTWLWWMRNLLDSGKAREIEGKVPERDEIRALPGKTDIGSPMGINTKEAVRYLEDYEKQLAAVVE